MGDLKLPGKYWKEAVEHMAKLIRKDLELGGHNKMYILIMEDGEVGTIKELTENEIEACNDNYVNIIDPRTLKQYYRGDWYTLKDFSG